MNNWTGIGRMTQDPELKYLSGSGSAVCSFTIAVDKGLSKDKKAEMESRGKPTADFIRIKVWGKRGENVANYGFKGMLVAVQGSITTSVNDKDGVKTYYTDINAFNVEFLSWKDDTKKEKKEFEIKESDFSSVEDDDDIFF